MTIRIGTLLRPQRLGLCLGLALVLGLAGAVRAESAGVLRLSTPLPLGQAYDRVFQALEAQRYWVVFEADMGERMARFKDAWGEDYNRSGLGGIRAMVFCNLERTNAIANADPDLLALCPLHLTLFERGGLTYAVLPRLSILAQGGPGEAQAADLERTLKDIVEKALAP